MSPMETVETSHIKEVYDGQVLLAIVIPRTFRQPGVSFFTPPDYSQQLAYIQHPRGHTIPAHVHNPVLRSVQFTQETIFVRSGKLKVNLYSAGHEYVGSELIEAGDVLFLIAGGHGFEVVEDVDMIEVKQGPYTDDRDKTHFVGVETAPVWKKQR